MIRKYALPFVALFGVVAAAVAVIIDNQGVPAVPPAMPAPKAPFASYVTGAGMVEASSQNIAIGTPVSGVVAAIYVKLSDAVKAGEPLLKIDDRDLQGQLLIAAARVKEAEANLAKTRNLLESVERLPTGVTISAVDKANRRYDAAVNEAVLGAAKAQVEQLKIEIDRRTIRAPIAGAVLQLKTRLGEFVQGGNLASPLLQSGAPLMVLGDTRRLHVRVDIDEFDSWRVRADAAARAFVRGDPHLNAPLKFEYFEPYVVPKTSLTGASTERTDTRVLQVVYSFDPAALPVYVGQQMDVFIEAPPIGRASAATAAPANTR